MNELGPVDLNLFRVFDAVYRAGSITRAATQLHLTQPAVSNALTRLRAHFDDPLFVRDGRRVVPTPHARSLAGEIARALGTLQDAVKHGRRFDPTTSSRRFVIGMRDSMESTLLPRLARDVQRRWPRLSLLSTRFERRRLSRQLAAGELDLAVDLPFSTGDDLMQKEFMRTELCVVMRRRHPLARGKLTLETWLSARHVVVSARPNGPVLEDLALRQLGRTRDIALRCQHYYAAWQVVAASDFLLTMPRNDGDDGTIPLPLTIAPLPVPFAPLPVMLYWHRSADGDPANRWMRERLEELAGT
jgi:DNA-binding transcriptional LysR family regulator